MILFLGAKIIIFYRFSLLGIKFIDIKSKKHFTRYPEYNLFTLEKD